MIAALVYFQYDHRIHKSEAASSDIFFEEHFFFLQICNTFTVEQPSRSAISIKCNLIEILL